MQNYQNNVLNAGLSKVPELTLIFWAAFILTRPLGAVVGDFLDKPVAQGGLALCRYLASIALIVISVACILFFPQRTAKNATH